MHVSSLRLVSSSKHLRRFIITEFGEVLDEDIIGKLPIILGGCLRRLTPSEQDSIGSEVDAILLSPEEDEGSKLLASELWENSDGLWRSPCLDLREPLLHSISTPLFYSFCGYCVVRSQDYPSISQPIVTQFSRHVDSALQDDMILHDVLWFWTYLLLTHGAVGQELTSKMSELLSSRTNAVRFVADANQAAGARFEDPGAYLYAITSLLSSPIQISADIFRRWQRSNLAGFGRAAEELRPGISVAQAVLARLERSE